MVCLETNQWGFNGWQVKNERLESVTERYNETGYRRCPLVGFNIYEAMIFLLNRENKVIGHELNALNTECLPYSQSINCTSAAPS